MKPNILSYALTAYALYNALTAKNELKEQQERITDILNNQEDLAAEVDKLTVTTHTLIGDDLKVAYSLVLGRPTSMSRLSGSLHFTITNTSTKNTYIVKGIQFTPILGTTFCNDQSNRLFNLYWKAGVTLVPGMNMQRRIAHNNLQLDSSTFKTVCDAVLEKFHAAYLWNKLGDQDAELTNKCSADVWLLANAPYVDGARDHVILHRGMAGNLRWRGGNYLPGGTNKDQGEILPFYEAKRVFE